jgi:hypothetical protein
MDGEQTRDCVGDGWVESNSVQGHASRCGEGPTDARKGGQFSSGKRSGVCIAECATSKRISIRRRWVGVGILESSLGGASVDRVGRETPFRHSGCPGRISPKCRLCPATWGGAILAGHGALVEPRSAHVHSGPEISEVSLQVSRHWMLRGVNVLGRDRWHMQQRPPSFRGSVLHASMRPGHQFSKLGGRQCAH